MREKNHQLVALARDKFGRQLRAVGRKLVRNPDDVTDRLQDFYAHLLRIDVPDDIESLEGFFIEVFSNLTRDWLRRNARRGQLETGADEEAAGVADGRDDPEARLSEEQKLKVLYDVLASVPYVVRRAFVLRKTERKSHAEISALLKIPFHKVEEHLATVGRRYKKALQRVNSPGWQREDL